MNDTATIHAAYRAPTLSAPPSWELDAAHRLGWWAITLRAMSALAQLFSIDGPVPRAPAHTAAAASMLVVGVAAWRLQRTSNRDSQRIAAWIAAAIVGVFSGSAASMVASERIVAHLTGTPANALFEHGVPVIVTIAGLSSVLAPLALAFALLARRSSSVGPSDAVGNDHDAARARASSLRSFATSAYGIVLAMVGSISIALVCESFGATFLQTASVRGAGLVLAAVAVARALRASRSLLGWSPSVSSSSGAFALWIAALASALVTLGLWVHVVRDVAGRAFIRSAWASQGIVECSTLLALVATAHTAARLAPPDDRERLTRRSRVATGAVCALGALLAWIHVDMPDFIMRTELQRWTVYGTMAFAVAAVVAVAGVASAASRSLAKQSSRDAHVSG